MIYIILGVLLIWGLIATGVFVGMLKQLGNKIEHISGGEFISLVMIAIIFPIGIYAICTEQKPEEKED